MTRPANTPRLTPYLTVSNARSTLDFYQRAFGFAAAMWSTRTVYRPMPKCPTRANSS